MEKEQLMETEAPPVNICLEKLPFIEYNNVKINEHLYNIKIYQAEDSIIFNANLINEIFELLYEREYTLSEFYIINRFFKQYSTTKELYTSFFKNFKEKDIIPFKTENKINLAYKFESLKKENEIDFVLVTSKIKIENILFKFSDKINQVIRDQKEMNEIILNEIKAFKKKENDVEKEKEKNENINNINNINEFDELKSIKANLKEQKKTNKNVKKDLDTCKNNIDKQREINEKIMKEIDEIKKKKDNKIDKVLNFQYKQKFIKKEKKFFSLIKFILDNKFAIIILIFGILIIKEEDTKINKINFQLRDIKIDNSRKEKNIDFLKKEVNKTNEIHSKNLKTTKLYLGILQSNITRMHNYNRNHLNKEINKNKKNINNIKIDLEVITDKLEYLNQTINKILLSKSKKEKNIDCKNKFNLTGEERSLIIDDLQKVVNSKISIGVTEINKEIVKMKDNLKRFDKEKNINELDNFDYFKSFINEELQKSFNKKINEYKILYRASKDGFNVENFHAKCDGKGSTLTIILTKTKELLGGFAKYSWNKNNEYKKGREGFIFSINNNIISKTGKYNIYCKKENGPVFGNFDIFISNNSNLNYESYYNIKFFNKSLFNNYLEEKNALIKQNFSVLDYAVYQVEFNDKIN